MGKKESKKKILVINLGGLGDILLSLPALKALRQMEPRAQIHLLVVPRVLKMASRIKEADKIWAIGRGKTGFFEDFVNLIALRRERFDLALNMRSLISSGGAFKLRILLSLISAGKTAGRNTEGRGGFFDVSVPELEKGAKHELTYNKELIETLGGQVEDENIDWTVSQETLARVNSLLAESGIKESDVLIGIHPGGRLSRRWPEENFLGMIKLLRAEYPCRFVITGTAGEEALGRYLKDNSGGGVINLVDRLNIEGLFALIKRCNCFVSNDTGPMHFAAILKTPLVALFGPGDLGHYDPRAVSKKVIVLKKDTGCAPCSRIKCDDLRCLKAISVEETAGAVKKLL